jgi:hypothetical protein
MQSKVPLLALAMSELGRVYALKLHVKGPALMR